MTALDRLSDRITVRQYGLEGLITGDPESADADAAWRGLAECGEAILSGDYRLIILDEANVAPVLRLFPVDELIALIDAKPEEVELVITGRGADPRVVNRADLVTEMRDVKHYFRRGVTARVGIEN